MKKRDKERENGRRKEKESDRVLPKLEYSEEAGQPEAHHDGLHQDEAGLRQDRSV